MKYLYFASSGITWNVLSMKGHHLQGFAWMMIEFALTFDRCRYLSVTVGVDVTALRDGCSGVNCTTIE